MDDGDHIVNEMVEQTPILLDPAMIIWKWNTQELPPINDKMTLMILKGNTQGILTIKDKMKIIIKQVK